MQRERAKDSNDWVARADAVLAGAQSNFRTGATATPIIADRAEGFRIFDADGKDYIDFVLGMGPAIWGQSDPEYLAAVQEQMQRQFSSISSMLHTCAEIRLAELIVEHVPCAERVRFAMTGSEAVQLAMRVCRGATGRRYIMRCVVNYHGWLDNVFKGMPGSDGSIRPSPDVGAGQSDNAFSDMLMVPWGELDAIESRFQCRSSEIAGLILEPALCNFHCIEPPNGYLLGVRKLCDQYNIPLIFDEVITGFRCSLGGAQELYGVVPDLAIFGKALAGGLPLAAIAGKDSLLQELKQNRVLAGGTFNAFPLAMAAGVVSIEKLARGNREYFSRLDLVQEKVTKGLRESAAGADQPIIVQGPPGVISFLFTDRQTVSLPEHVEFADLQKADRFRALAAREGVLISAGSRLMLSGNMPDQDVNEAIVRLNRAMQALARE